MKTGRLGWTQRTMIVACLASVLPAGCARPPRWTTPDQPRNTDVRLLLDVNDPWVLFRDVRPSEVPRVPRPVHFRPCCAFGSNLRVRIGPVRIPGFDIVNILGPDDLGHHYYDNGLIQTGRTYNDDDQVESERNGLVYTCRGGFVDVAHVRNWIDWTTFLATTIARHLETGTVIPLRPKGGAISAHVRPVDRDQIDVLGRLRVALPLAQWIAYQASVWDEIVTWFGWSHLPLFPEGASSFSPEDLYSNLIGIKLTTAIVVQGSARSETLYDDSVDHWLDETLRHLEAVDQEVGREAAWAVDGLWWNSRRTVTDMTLVDRRHLDVGMPIVPWLVPGSRMPDSLRAACGEVPEPERIAIPERDLAGMALGERARLEIVLGDEIAKKEPFRSMPRRIGSRHFPEILAFIRADAQARFGPRVDEPD